MRKFTLCLSILVLALGSLLGCSGDGPWEPTLTVGEAAAEASASATAASASVAGEWTWSNVEALSIPAFLAAALGISPEGRNTHARCESTGTMSLVQTGSTFHGTANRTTNDCLTKGGQSFNQPGAAFVVEEGRIIGRTVHFELNGPLVMPCPHHAVISEAESGVATALSGTGRCVLPGHPQSESPLFLDPPPGGNSKTLSWEAVR